MNKYSLIAGCLLLACCNQNNNSKETLKSFSALGSNPHFAHAHQSPDHFVYHGKGNMISFPTSDGLTAGAFEIKAEKSTKNWLFVFHEWWGLNDHIREESEKYFENLEKVNVLALDLYDGKVATNPDSAATFMQAASEDRIRKIIQGAISYVGNKAEIGTIGWCFGGGWSMQASIMIEKLGIGCVVYYGMPESDPMKLAKLANDVLFIWPEQDEWITKEKVDAFTEGMTGANNFFILKTYAADHAFANPSNPRYNKVMADDAFATSIEYLQHRFDF